MNSNEIIVSEGNKHFNVFNFEEFQPAFDFGLLYSNKLNIDLLDATEKATPNGLIKPNYETIVYSIKTKTTTT